MTTIDTTAAYKYFKTTDPIMATVVKQALTAAYPIAIPQKKSVDAYFSSIATSIISQQISTKAADAIRGRVVSLLGTITPETVIAVDFDTLKQCGLSTKKTEYLKHNAQLWHTLPITELDAMNDEAVIKELTKLYGIGRWTAEMFLMFSLARPDVFSFGDLGLMKSLYRHYNFKPHYTRKIEATVALWSPHRTVASLALWHTIDNGPVLL